MPILTFLFHEIEIQKLTQIIVNISYDQRLFKIMDSPVVGGPINKLRNNKKTDVLELISEATSSHFESVSLNDLAFGIGNMSR